jgi:hypothetical protein
MRMRVCMRRRRRWMAPSLAAHAHLHAVVPSLAAHAPLHAVSDQVDLISLIL